MVLLLASSANGSEIVFIPRKMLTMGELLQESGKQCGVKISVHINDPVEKLVVYDHLVTLEQVLDAAREYYTYVAGTEPEIKRMEGEVRIYSLAMQEQFYRGLSADGLESIGGKIESEDEVPTSKPQERRVIEQPAQLVTPTLAQPTKSKTDAEKKPEQNREVSTATIRQKVKNRALLDEGQATLFVETTEMDMINGGVLLDPLKVAVKEPTQTMPTHISVEPVETLTTVKESQQSVPSVKQLEVSVVPQKDQPKFHPIAALIEQLNLPEAEEEPEEDRISERLQERRKHADDIIEWKNRQQFIRSLDRTESVNRKLSAGNDDQ